MLTLTHIDVTLGKGTPLQRQILKGLNLTVAPCEFVLIIGGNGAGKSTLFNVISGFLKPDQGEITLDDQNITHTPQQARAPLVSKVMQEPRMGTMENMTLLENMAFALTRGKRRALRPFSSLHRRQYFQEKLALLGMGLEDRLDSVVAHLSGGQRQALSLIMAILADSKILLLDEITAALDPQMAEKVMKIAEIMVRQEKRTCLMITHNMTHALTYGDRILLLKEGRLMKEFGPLEKEHLTPLSLAAAFEA